MNTEKILFRIGEIKMSEVYVLYGRKDFNEAVFDHDGNYFRESPVLELYENFDDALNKLKEYAIEAYESMKKYGDLVVDTHFAEVTTEADLFDWYNCGEDMDNSIIERDVCWIYDEFKSINYVAWQMQAFNVPWGEETPILPGLYIKKCKINL